MLFINQIRIYSMEIHLEDDFTVEKSTIHVSKIWENIPYIDPMGYCHVLLVSLKTSKNQWQLRRFPGNPGCAFNCHHFQTLSQHHLCINPFGGTKVKGHLPSDVRWARWRYKRP